MPANTNYPFTFKIAGEAGFGVKSSGLIFSKVATRCGYNIFDYLEYPSVIRGGHNVMQVAVSNESIYSQYSHTNLLVALNQETVDKHKSELIEGSLVLYDPHNPYHGIDEDTIPSKAHKVGVPLNDIAKETGKTVIMRNTVALGAVIGLLGGNLDHLKDLIAENFASKDPIITERNHLCAEEGYNYILENFQELINPVLKERDIEEKRMVMSGNEAAALGSISSGLTFAAIYPMTPTSNILHTLAPHQGKYGYVYKQPEDEISAINMALGASHAGARSMVATSGGGFCLMAEGYGLAGITETPVVIIEGMRGSPATGLPTWTEQGDLQFVLRAHQGDFPRIVLTPGDVEEVFDLTFKAFNLADKYQTPVVILVDTYLCEGNTSIQPFNSKKFKIDRGKYVDSNVEGYKRYEMSSDGISPRAVAGSGNHFVANSDEHNEVGFSDEGIENRNKQMQKRMQKMVTCANEDMEDPKLYGPEEADVTIVSWGSNKGPIREAIKHMKNVNFLHITWASPFPERRVKEVLEKAKYIINIECNYSAQMGALITEKTGIKILDNMLKYDGRPFYPEEIVKKIKEVLQSN